MSRTNKRQSHTTYVVTMFDDASILHAEVDYNSQIQNYQPFEDIYERLVSMAHYGMRPSAEHVGFVTITPEPPMH